MRAWALARYPPARMATLSPVRTAKLPCACDLGIAWGDRLVLCDTRPDRSYVLDLDPWPMTPRPVVGLFATSMAQTRSGRVFAVARHHHQNPYKLYELDLASAQVRPHPVEAPWHDITSVFAVGERVVLVPGGDLRASGHRPAWWHEGGRVEALDLPTPEPPAPMEWQGRSLGRPAPQDRVDVIALPDDEALVVWFERLYRVTLDGVTPTALDGLFAAWEPLREGRHSGLDDQGRALTIVHDHFVALDRDGVLSEVVPGAYPVRSAVRGPEDTWFLVCGETLLWVFPRAREVVELDLRPMRLAPTMALFCPKPLWVAARDELLVLHSHDVHAFDLGALRGHTRLSWDKLAKKRVASRRSLWNRKLKAAHAAPMALDALSQHTRGGSVVEHPRYGVGVVQHATESSHRGVTTVVATVLFEDGGRQFYFAGDRWIERPWSLGLG